MEPNWLTHGDSGKEDMVQEAWDRLTPAQQHGLRLEYVDEVLKTGDLDDVYEEGFWAWLEKYEL